MSYIKTKKYTYYLIKEDTILKKNEMLKEAYSFLDIVDAETSMENDSELDLNLEPDKEDVFQSQEGILRVDGTVFIGSIQRRGKTSKTQKARNGVEPSVKMSNVVNTVGYRITNLETNEWFFLEKMEAIDLVQQLGIVNASIRPRKSVSKDADGKVISTDFHLNLHPIKDERPFTDANRLFPVFRLDKNGKMVKPTELFIDEEHCTPTLWKIIQEEYDKRKPRNNRAYRKITSEEKLSRIEQAMRAANFSGAANPFAK